MFLILFNYIKLLLIIGFDELVLKFYIYLVPLKNNKIYKGKYAFTYKP